MPRIRRVTCLAFLLLLAARTAAAGGPVVPGFERFGRAATDPTARVEAGLLLLGELGCVNCHAPTDAMAAHLAAKKGPVLDDVGRRLAPDWLVRYVRNPHAVKPGTTMPDLLEGLPESDRDRTATAIAHFLASTGGFDETAFKGADKAKPKEGDAIYERVGCAACHGSRKTNVEPLPDHLPLVDIGVKWSPQALERFLADPLAVRPSGRMPAISLKDNERQHLAASLLGKLPPAAGDYRNVVAFNGRVWLEAVGALPDVGSLGPPAKEGPARGFDVASLAGAKDNFIVQLHGFLHAPLTGTYRLHLTSDDGGRVSIGERMVVDNDGIHPESERTGSIELKAGIHPIRIDYFEATGNEVLGLEVSPPRGRRLSALALVTPTADGRPAVTPEDAATDGPGGFAVDAALVEQGRAAFTAIGCAQCHQMRPAAADARQPSMTRRDARPLGPQMRTDAGCLSPASATGPHPRYGLDDAQRDAIAAAVAWLKTAEPELKPDRERSIDRMMTSLNCYACHARAAAGVAPKGGVIPAVASVDDDGEPILKEAARDALFTTAIQELGDEGRLPPTLAGVGDKLRPEFLVEVLKKGGEDRGGYMHTRMPRWHASSATAVAALFAEDPKTEIPVPSLGGHKDAEIDEQGRHLVGSKALGCIKCHAFGGQKGQGQGVVDLLRMPKRLRHEWFLAYVADPQRFRPGTRMPAAWPEGKSFYPDVLDGMAPSQIEAVWRYLAGPEPRQPVGAGNNPIELAPKDRPILYRNFIEGAGPRAIGVGYPEKVNLAWDAENLRLALAWRGAFIDAGRHWTGRGQGFQPPLGDHLISPDAAAAIEVLPNADAAWPENPRSRGGRFGGYTLDGVGRPTFAWSSGGMDIAESFEPTAAGNPPVIRRVIRVRGRPGDGEAFFRAASAATIEDAGDGWRRVDGRWRVRVTGSGVGSESRLEQGGRTELRFPVVWSAGDTADIVEELSW